LWGRLKPRLPAVVDYRLSNAAYFLLERGFKSAPQSGRMIVAGLFKARIRKATKKAVADSDG